MGVQQAQSVLSTTQTLVNTGRVRGVLNNMLQYNPNVPLSSVQIQVLLRSPLESMIKSIIFFDLVQGEAKQVLKHEYFCKLLEKMGLKDLAERYHAWVLKRKAEQSKSVPIPEELLEFEQYRPQPVPIFKNEELESLQAVLNTSCESLVNIRDALGGLFKKHQALVQKLVLLNQNHIDEVLSLARDAGIVLEPYDIMTLLPRAHRAYHVAETREEQLASLRLLIQEGVNANNDILFVEQFMMSGALNVAMNAYEVASSNLHFELNEVSLLIVEHQMRETETLLQIQEVQARIREIQNAAPQQRQVVEPIRENDLHDLLNNLAAPMNGMQ